jgi:tetratricopeptide (TPR) repeat protein
LGRLIETLLENALFLADTAEKASARSLSFIEVAEVFLEAGLKDRCLDTLAGALKVVETLPQPNERVLRLAWAAGLFSRAGDDRTAKELFQRSTLLARAIAEDQKIQALSEIAGEYLELDLKQEALALLGELGSSIGLLANEVEKAHQLTVLADLLAEFQEKEEALRLLEAAFQITRQIKDNWFKAERLVEIAQSLSQSAQPDRSAAVLEEALVVSARIEAANRPYFIFNIIDLLLELGRQSQALELANGLLEIINQDPSTFSRAGALVELAERYRDAGSEKKALNLLTFARETADKAESDTDRISSYARIGELQGQLGETQPALELAEKAFYLCGHIQNARTHIYLLGDLAQVFEALGAREKSARCVSRILELVDQSDVRTLGLGEVANELAEAGEIVLALKLTAKIREPEVKSGSLCAIASAMIAQGLEANEEIELAVRELSDGTSSQRGLY